MEHHHHVALHLGLRLEVLMTGLQDLSAGVPDLGVVGEEVIFVDERGAGGAHEGLDDLLKGRLLVLVGRGEALDERLEGLLVVVGKLLIVVVVLELVLVAEVGKGEVLDVQVVEGVVLDLLQLRLGQVLALGLVGVLECGGSWKRRGERTC